MGAYSGQTYFSTWLIMVDNTKRRDFNIKYERFNKADLPSNEKQGRRRKWDNNRVGEQIEFLTLPAETQSYMRGNTGSRESINSRSYGSGLNKYSNIRVN